MIQKPSKRTRRAAFAVVLAGGLVAAACGGDNKSSGSTATTAAQGSVTTVGQTPTTTAAGGATSSGAAASDLGATLKDGQYNENYTPSQEILTKGLAGAGSLPAEERARNVALATLDRAEKPVDEDLALKCWKENGCKTGTNGKLKVGLADGFGGNIARQIFKMEFILQALTYPEIGEIAFCVSRLASV